MMPQQTPQPPQDPAVMLHQHALQIHQQMAQQIRQLEQTVTVERVITFLRDERTRSFAIEIETDSTIMPDEAAEKQSRSEFLGAFSQASSGVAQLLQLGPSGAELAGGLLKFALAPYRVGRQLDGLIEKFTEQAPQIVEQQMKIQQQGQDPALAQAQLQLAQAEQQKAQAQMQKVQADTQLQSAKLQLDQQKAQAEFAHKQQVLQIEAQQAQATLAETLARVEHVKAETEALLANAQTSRQTANNDTARTIAEVGKTQFEQDQALMQPAVTDEQPQI